MSTTTAENSMQRMEYIFKLLANTGHFWYLHNPEYPEKGTIILFHKHKADDKYHLRGRGNSLGQVVRSIKSHDRFQLNGRKPVRR